MSLSTAKNLIVKNKAILFLTVIFAGVSSFGQTTATDFTANDCSGTSYNLFNELDNGKVVVIAWTMPCFGCIGPCIAAHDAAASFSGSNPGEVDFYLVDDYADTDCASLEGWGATYGLVSTKAYFSNAAIDMNDYGTPGMPKVVVIGCSGTHKIFFNKNSAPTYTEIQAAIGEALSSSACALGVDELGVESPFELNVYPNPVVAQFNISFNLLSPSNVLIEVIDFTGAVVGTVSNAAMLAGNHTSVLSTEDYAGGIYIVKISTDDAVETKKVVVTK